MGASLTLEDYARAARRPGAVLVGLLSQFGWMPLLAYFAIDRFGLEGTDALGLLLMACTSGGNASNMFGLFRGCGRGPQHHDDPPYRHSLPSC